MTMIQTIKFAWQRLTRGYDDRLFWSLADYIDPMIVAHVKNLREEGHGHPVNISEKKWDKVLDTIIAGMVQEPETLAGKGAWKKYRKNRNKALVLLAFYWDELWD